MRFEHKIEHLLVDLDGTLLGNRALSLGFDFVKQAFGSVRKHGGWRKALEALYAIQAEFRHAPDQITPENANDYRVVKRFSEKMNLPPEEGRKILREGIASIFPSLEKHFYPIQGAKEFLDWAKGRYQLHLATNPVWPKDIAELRLKWAGIDPTIFTSVTEVREMHACKPSRQYYEEVLAQRGLKPEQTLLIGNDLKMDLPAVVVGIPVYIVGDFKAVSPLKYPHAQALAFRGPYEGLQAMLRMQQQPGSKQTD